MKINTVIFDIGGVMIGYDWDKYLMEITHDREKTEEMKLALFKSGLWDEVDRGIWSEEELLAAFIRRAGGLEEEIHRFWEHTGDALWQYDFAKPLILDLKARGCQVLYLSNWSKHLRLQAAKQLDFLPLMDGGVMSYEEKLIKPDEAIYRRILEKYHLDPQTCVFLDDKKKNTDAAENCGMHTIQVIDQEEAHQALYRMLEEE